MEQNVSEELDTLKGMIENWKKGFLSWASPDGDNEHVISELVEDIQLHVYPYVKRLFEANYLSEIEAKEFMHYCFSQVEDLRVQLSNVQTDKTGKEA